MSAIKEHFHDKIERRMRIAQYANCYNIPDVQTIRKIWETSEEKTKQLNVTL